MLSEVGRRKIRFFDVSSGLRLRCSIEATLYNIALEWVMRRMTAKGRMRLGGNKIDRMAYSDDVDIFLTESLEEVDVKRELFATVARTVGLHITENKPKLITSATEYEYDDCRVQCVGLNAEGVDRFKFLGAVLSADDE